MKNEIIRYSDMLKTENELLLLQAKTTLIFIDRQIEELENQKKIILDLLKLDK